METVVKNVTNLTWFAMRATFNREMKAKEILKSKSIECFVPMRYEMKQNGRKMKRELVPAIRNLIFVHTTESVINETKLHIPYLKHILNVVDGKMRPLIVPNDQMEQFIAIIGIDDQRLTYLDPKEIDFIKGDKVIITSGVFKDKEGVFVKVKGKRSKQVVVAIEGIMAVMIADLDPTMITKII